MSNQSPTKTTAPLTGGLRLQVYDQVVEIPPHGGFDGGAPPLSAQGSDGSLPVDALQGSQGPLPYLPFIRNADHSFKLGPVSPKLTNNVLEVLEVDNGGGGVSAAFAQHNLVTEERTAGKRDALKSKTWLIETIPAGTSRAEADNIRRFTDIKYTNIRRLILEKMEQVLVADAHAKNALGVVVSDSDVRAWTFIDEETDKDGNITLQFRLNGGLPDDATPEEITRATAFVAATLHVAYCHHLYSGDFTGRPSMLIGKTGTIREVIVKMGPDAVAQFEADAEWFLQTLGHEVKFKVLSNKDEAHYEGVDTLKYILKNVATAGVNLDEYADCGVYVLEIEEHAIGSTTTQSRRIRLMCDPKTGIWTAKLIGTTFAGEFGSSAKKTHSDRVIADELKALAEDGDRRAFEDRAHKLFFGDMTPRKNPLYYGMMNSLGHAARGLKGKFAELIKSGGFEEMFHERFSKHQLGDATTFLKFLDTAIASRPLNKETYVLYVCHTLVFTAIQLGYQYIKIDGRIVHESTPGGNWLDGMCQVLVEKLPSVKNFRQTTADAAATTTADPEAE